MADVERRGGFRGAPRGGPRGGGPMRGRVFQSSLQQF